MLLVLPVLRGGTSCRYRLRLGPQLTHVDTRITLARPLRLRVRACRCYAYRTKNPPLYVLRVVQSNYQCASVLRYTAELCTE